MAGQRDDRHGGFRHLVRGHPLDGVGDQIAGPLIGLILKLRLILVDLQGLFVGQLLGQIVEQIFLGLFGGEAGDALQHLELALLQVFHIVETVLDIPLLFRERLFFFLIILNLAVQGFFLLLDPPFLTLHVVAALLELSLRLVAQAMDFVLRL